VIKAKINKCMSSGIKPYLQTATAYKIRPTLGISFNEKTPIVG
jgi:hypothetical protein